MCVIQSAVVELKQRPVVLVVARDVDLIEPISVADARQRDINPEEGVPLQLTAGGQDR